MAKTTGLGARLLVHGYDFSGDIQAVDNIHGGPAALDFTGIDKSAYERLGCVDGGLDVTAFFNKGTSADRAHDRYSTLPTTDVITTYCHGSTLGNPAASLVGKQTNYDGKRGNDGSFTFSVAAVANGYGLEWGQQLTAGIETSTNSLTGAMSTFEGGIGTWVTQDANATVAASAAQARTGTGSLAITSTGTSDAGARHVVSAAGFAVTPGRAYLVQAWFRAATAARTVRAQIVWYTSGASIVSTSTAGSATDSTSTWTLAAGSVVAPATAAFAVVRVTVVAPGAASEVHYVDDVSFVPMPASLDLGTGSTLFGAQAYLHVTAFTGTDATITLHSSTDDAATDAYSAITGGAFTAVTAVGAQRIATSSTATIERYIQPVVTTTGGFSALSYHITVVRNDTSTVF